MEILSRLFMFVCLNIYEDQNIDFNQYCFAYGFRFISMSTILSYYMVQKHLDCILHYIVKLV